MTYDIYLKKITEIQKLSEDKRYCFEILMETIDINSIDLNERMDIFNENCKCDNSLLLAFTIFIDEVKFNREVINGDIKDVILGKMICNYTKYPFAVLQIDKTHMPILFN